MKHEVRPSVQVQITVDLSCLCLVEALLLILLPALVHSLLKPFEHAIAYIETNWNECVDDHSENDLVAHDRIPGWREVVEGSLKQSET